MTPVQIAQQAIPSIARIIMADGVGTGFVVGEDGLIATNLHVISGNNQATVVLSDGREFKDIEILAADDQQDLALLRIPATHLRALKLGDSGSVVPGERVVAIGNPLGLGNTVSDGLVSGLREIAPDFVVLQISAPISPGSSGGPLFNERGEVIGVATLVMTKGQNLNFGIPVNALKPMLGNTEGIPLSEWRWPKRGRREVPTHEEALLDGCADADLEHISDQIQRAISIGAPLYNDGNHEACFRIYQATALDVARKVKGCEGPKRALLDGVARSESLASYTDKAWAMRDAFDGLLEVIDRRGGDAPAGSSSLPPAPTRAVPKHPTSLLSGEPSEQVSRLAQAIVSAIGVGAPLYNEGHFEACFRVYEGAILDLDRTLPGCAGARRALAEGLRNAGLRESWSDKAWALRDSFDGILNLVDRLLAN